MPGEALSETELLVTFDSTPAPTPEAASFHLRALELAIGPPATETTLPDDAELMAEFESLGDDCEFGFVQRHYGIEPLGIFRFAGTRHLGNLLRLLETDLEGMGAPGSLTATLRDAHIYRHPEPPLVVREFMMDHGRLGLNFHTFRGPDVVSEEEAKQENEQKLRYLRRKFLEDLEDGQKIWLLRDARRQDVNEAFAFQTALNRKGRNKLFWITRTIEGRPAGSVEWIGEDLLRGYLDQQHLDAQIFTPEIWLELCRHAWRAFAEREAAR